ncbi:MAG: tol-pal system YbgF family protein [Candidatus Aminicenantia bacterium]
MKKISLFLLIGLLINTFSGLAQSLPDEKLFQEAKILIFDEKWSEAQQKLDEIITRYPNSKFYPSALFYKGKCLEEQKARKEAMEVYEKYLKISKEGSLREEAEVSIIDLAFDLYRRGNKPHLKKIEDRLKSKNKVIQYYAAFKLSYFKDKKIATKGVPILKKIINFEQDEELRDRAKIALLRIDPDFLKEVKKEEITQKGRILKIRIFEKGKRKPKVSVNIPWALADLALKALSEKQKSALREEGYDLDKILRDLSSLKEPIIIEVQDEDEIIRIWIE